MPRRLAPLNGLRAFEVSARHLSFTRAAKELSVTPAAVSLQVKSLEEYFGVPLFKRLTRALVLTEAGQQVLPLLRQGFDKLAEADRKLREQKSRDVLSVTVAPLFGAKWLVPRLHRFRLHAPQYEIRIDSSDTLVDLLHDNIDLALRYGNGEYPGLVSECILVERVVPVCSPDLLMSEHPLERPEDLRHHTLIHSHWESDKASSPSWRMWLKAAGVNDIEAERGPRFNLGAMALQAAIEGHGVALTEYALVTHDLEQNRLVMPFSDRFLQETRFCYYLVYREENLEQERVAAFREWLLGEVESDQTA